MRSKEFVSKAEGIKSHELSVKSLMEIMEGTLSGLNDRKNSLEKWISSLYSELAAAENDTDEDGDPDYGLIASIENQIDQAKDELDITESEISQTSGELEKAEQEYERVAEEKQQTLFEIQQRARTTSQNMSIAGGMYGAYADIGNSLNQSFQTSFDALAQAASILDGSVGAVGGGSSSGGTCGGGSEGGSVGSITETTVAIASANTIMLSKPFGSGFVSTQMSGGHSTSGNLRNAAGGGMPNNKNTSFHSGQSSLLESAEGASLMLQAISGRKSGSFSSRQTSSFAGAKAGIMANSSSMGALRIAGKLSSGQVSHGEINRSKNIVGIKCNVSGHFAMNTQKTIGLMREQMTDAGKKYFDQQINAGGGVVDQKVHLQGAGAEFYMTSTSTDERSSGNFLTREHPGATPQERKENLQLPTGNEAAIVEKVRSVKPAVVLISKVAPQKQWAEESGYTAREGMQQIFTPNKNINGAIAAGIYEVIDLKDGESIQAVDNTNQMDVSFASKKLAEQSNIQETSSVAWSSKLRDRAQGFFSSFFSSSSGRTGANLGEGDEISKPTNQILSEITSTEYHEFNSNSIHQQFADLSKIEVNNLSKENLSSIVGIAVQNLRSRYGNTEASARFDSIGKKISFINDKEVRMELGHYYSPNICGYYSPSSDTIRINMNGNATVGDILATIDHETMHLLSKHTKSQGGVLNSNILDNNVGMNEGITEMLSIKNMQSINPNYVSNSYTDEVGIMQRFESICGEKELLDAYMKNDMSKIESEFNQLLGSRKAFEKFCNDIDILHRYNYVYPTDKWAPIYRAETKKRIFQKLDRYQAAKLGSIATVASTLSTDKLQMQSDDSKPSMDIQLRFGLGQRTSTEKNEASETASVSTPTHRDEIKSFIDKLYGGLTYEQQAENARKRRNTTTSGTSGNEDFYKEERQRLQADDRER